MPYGDYFDIQKALLRQSFLLFVGATILFFLDFIFNNLGYYN